MATARKPTNRRPRSDLLEPAARTGEVDHRTVELLRARPALKSITLRLGVEQIEEARRTAAVTGVPYQVVLRQWIALGASAAQSSRRRSRKPR